MPDWTHNQCIDCWTRANADTGREPIRLKKPEREPCCFCGALNQDGIYVRADPKSAAIRCGGEHP
jgi:hypothetical protein